jgi:hypothetical protein
VRLDGWSFRELPKPRRETSGAKARKFIATYRRHKCLLHPVTVYIFDENFGCGELEEEPVDENL